MANKNYDMAHTKWMCKYHIMRDKLSVKEYEDPFREKTVKNKKNNPVRK